MVSILIVIWLIAPLPPVPLFRWSLGEHDPRWRFSAAVACSLLTFVYGFLGAISIEMLADDAWGGVGLAGAEFFALIADGVAYAVLLLGVALSSAISYWRVSLPHPSRRLTVVAFVVAWIVGFAPVIVQYDPTDIAHRSRQYE